MATSPKSLLRPYQREFNDDRSRFKAACWPRQCGKDHTMAHGIAEDVYSHIAQGTKGHNHLIAAPSERQSLDSFEKVKQWVEVYKIAVEDIVEDRENSEALLKSASIHFPNGVKVEAVPGRPDTVRGKTAHANLTEFAFFEKPDETWRALYPSITSSQDLKMRLVSTPNGRGNRFADIILGSREQKEEARERRLVIPAEIEQAMDEAVRVAEAQGRGANLTRDTANMSWSTYWMSIYEAVKRGLNVNLYELYAGMDDIEGWRQEFECQFLDTAAVLLAYELIALCESEEATAGISPEYWQTKGQFPTVLGIDFGRKVDLTVCWAAEKVSDLKVTKEVVELQGMSTPRQIEILRPRIAKAQRVCFDYTGPGVGMGDFLVDEFGEWNPDKDKFGKIELCTFTNTLKVDICSKLKMEFEARNWRIPSRREIREDLHSVYRVTTPSGNTSYRAPHLPGGHADRFTALALCNRAATAPTGPFSYRPVDLSLSRGHLGGRRFVL